MSTQPTTDGLRALLAAVLDAIDLPHPATIGDTEAYRAVLDRRAALAVTTARAALAENPDDYGWNADHLRQRLTEYPATGYRHCTDTEAGR
ncbi:hypothetical protein F2B00_00275 [Streptomyces parvus]|uniref:hypothetical protein n=1 Tax=Streptomyces parvus TaxID=66428 RepID=UPI00123A9A2C|nr:hypothetical protein [Streptomyces parvus]KAA6204270.1 hypothetical protein F2B00_00275 [Streptomyces parvus]GGS27915.1 hypothetical protein GCM10010221_26990 [Streptomyces parvus]